LRFYKTVIAYMSGLAIRKVGEDEALAAWTARPAFRDPADKVLRDYLFWETALKAREHNLAFQVHTGHTSHINVWPNTNPILMTPLLNEPEMQDARFVLVHGGYPYCTEAGYLTSVYPKISLDLSLMIPWSSIGIARRIEETLESAPTSKIMYGSDGIEVPELYWISALNARKALGRVLDRLIEDGVLDDEEALDVGKDILYRNAERVYGISIEAGKTA
jgi:predicted TIM-barrel fold metal-dependent hydrolase